MKAKRLSKAKRLPSDRITTLPETIIETILCLLPIEDAARTSILSSEWRYKWTKIPKLVFFHSTVKRPTEKKPLSAAAERSLSMYESEKRRIELARANMDMGIKLFYAIHQVLLLRQGPIHEFILSMDADRPFFEIDQIIIHLSRNHTLKKLKFYFYESCYYRLPSCAFSLHHLTDLDLEYCHIDHVPICNGFSNLTSLSLKRLSISKDSLLRLLSNCPSLKSLCLLLLVELLTSSGPNIVELFKCLPVIEHFTTWCYFISWLHLPSVPEEITASSLIPLKYFCIKEFGFIDAYGLHFLAVLMKCSPNLEKIELEIDTSVVVDVELIKLEEYSAILEEYSDVWLEHLTELKTEDFGNFEPQLEFVKFILARSPNLKKVILLTYIDDKNEELKLLRILLSAPRVSPVEIVVVNRFKDDDDDYITQLC